MSTHLVLVNSEFKQVALPDVVDAFVAKIPAGTYKADAGATSFSLPGIYGPGDFITSVTPVAGTGFASSSNIPACTVELRNSGSTTVGTLYQVLGTTVTCGASLGVPLNTSAWIHVSFTGAGTFTASGNDARMIVTFVHEA
jgi:hypothetical protein